MNEIDVPSGKSCLSIRPGFSGRSYVPNLKSLPQAVLKIY